MTMVMVMTMKAMMKSYDSKDDDAGATADNYQIMIRTIIMI